MLTGTPAAQSPLDAFGLARLVNPKAVPRYMSTFRDSIMYKVTPFKYAPKENATEVVHNALQPAIRFTKAECLDLPDIVFTHRETPMTRQQKKYYDQLRKAMAMEAAGEEVTSANAAVNINKLLQISSGAVYTDNRDVLEFDVSSKYNALLEILDDTEHKVIVFAPFKHAINNISERLAKDGVTNEVITGSVNASARTDIFRQFQESNDPRVLVIQPQAAAHGVTLTAASTIVWWGPTNSLETYAQANARIHRAEQKNKCLVVQLRGSPVEDHVYKMLDNKENIHGKIIDLYRNILD
jgi:SNF2 family DNA or RNA helicase